MTIPVVVSEFLEEESDDLVELMPERCDQPGIVKNRSSFVVLIKGDYAGKPYEFQVWTLYPGQDSDKHTDMCDVDYITVPTTWWFNIDHRHAHQWSPYISYNTFVCYDKEYVENEVWCRYEWRECGDLFKAQEEFPGPFLLSCGSDVEEEEEHQNKEDGA